MSTMSAMEMSGTPLVREILTQPEQWPESPYLVVERRRSNRAGDDWCFLKAPENEDVRAVVYVAPTWPPPPNIDLTTSPTFAYNSFDDLQREGWRPSRSTDRVTPTHRV